MFIIVRLTSYTLRICNYLIFIIYLHFFFLFFILIIDFFYFFFFFFSSRRRHTRLVSDWSSDVCSSDLSLRESPLSGKEIIEKATIQSSGIWKPSPGLIYPMLGRLLDGGLIEEMDDGRYKITTKGLAMIKDIESVQSVFQKQFGVLLRLG